MPAPPPELAITLATADRVVGMLRGLVAAHQQMSSTLSRELASNLRTIAAHVESYEDTRLALLHRLERELATAEAATANLWARARAARGAPE
jgi:hypothetical protein